MASARTQSAAHRLRQDLRRLRHRSYITGEIDLAAVQDGGGERPRTEERVGERVRIARDLHDTLLQTVQVLMLRLQAVHEILPPGNAKDELEQTMEIGDQAIVVRAVVLCTICAQG